MIKLKKQKKNATPKRTLFIYKNLDNEFDFTCKSHFYLRYNGVEGRVEMRSTYYADVVGWQTNMFLSRLLTNSLPFQDNFLLFLMFRVNSVKIEIHSTYEPDLYTNPYSFGHIIYGVRFYPTIDSLVINPFKIINDPRTMTVTTKKPFHSQEIVFPKQYVITSDAQGYGRWLSCEYNVLGHGIDGSLQIGTQYQGYWPTSIPLGLMTVTFGVSFKELRHSGILEELR